jgi:hypothetical protein
LVDPVTNEPIKVESVSFSDIGIKERQDLERWIVNHPDLLGEDLFILTSEFDKFDKTNKRLDILALDSKGFLVIIELKLDAAHSLADLQAIRYAAFCSTMKMEEAIEELADFKEITKDEAAKRVLVFLKLDELPELENRPRIILAAGSMEDQELTSTILWLRGFQLDISCVELTPFKMPESSQIILVPRTIIPIPEAKEYQIKIQEKEESRIKEKKDRSQYLGLWRDIRDEFNLLGTSYQIKDIISSRSLKIPIIDEDYDNCYAWWIRENHSCLAVAIYFYNEEVNKDLIELIKINEEMICKELDLEFKVGGDKYLYAEFRIPYEGDFPGKSTIPKAASVMKILIERTLPLIKPKLEIFFRNHDSKI